MYLSSYVSTIKWTGYVYMYPLNLNGNEEQFLTQGSKKLKSTSQQFSCHLDNFVRKPNADNLTLLQQCFKKHGAHALRAMLESISTYK